MVRPAVRVEGVLILVLEWFRFRFGNDEPKKSLWLYCTERVCRVSVYLGVRCFVSENATLNIGWSVGVDTGAAGGRDRAGGHRHGHLPA